jgi:hypothetical protein
VPNVIFNIYNVFQVMQIVAAKGEGNLLYGMLASNFERRKVKEKRMEMSEKELDLVRNYDYLEDMMGRIDGQAALLQMSGYLKDSLEMYDRRVELLKGSDDASSEEEIGRCVVLKADALRRSGEYEGA